MSDRAKTLTERFEEANQELIRTVERCSDTQWRATTLAEGWSVGVAAHHLAEGHKAIARLIQAAASDQPLPPLSMEALDQRNAEHARQHVNCTRAETLELLRQNATEAAAMVRGLSDDQLDRIAQARIGPMKVQEMIERILIGHVQNHLGSIRATLAAP